MTEIIVATVLAVALIALSKNIWTHRNRCRRILGGVPARFLRWLAAKFKKKETEEQKQARRNWEMVNSDDPDIWKPLN